MRRSLALPFLCLCLASSNSRAQSPSLPDAPEPSPSLLVATASAPTTEDSSSSSSSAALSATPADPSGFSFYPEGHQQPSGASQSTQNTNQNSSQEPQPSPAQSTGMDADGKPIPLERQQPTRILGFMPNFRSVSGGAASHPPGWKYNFIIATHQSTDYSTFIFLGLTSLTAEAMNSHPTLGKGADGFYAYAWRGFIDKTDGTFLSAWLLPSILHEDTRYYALGAGHSIPIRVLYVLSRQAVARTYGGSQTPNVAGLGGKVLTQVISRYYYPPSADSFSALATKFGYSVMRDVAFSSIREFYPDIAAHYIRRHREKVAEQAARDAQPARATP